MDILNTMAKLDTSVVVVSYDPEWITWHDEENRLIRRVFDLHRIVAVEHFGSTSVPGLSAKPIVDILVGLNRFELIENEITALANIGYSFVEQSLYCQRFYFKKRGERSFNLSFVLFSGETWRDCIDVRDYLRVNPAKAQEYITIKQDAILNGCTKISEYSMYKFKFMKHLLVNAKSWRFSKE